MKTCGITKTRMYPAANAGGAAATRLIASLETSKSVTREKSRMPRHGGCDSIYLVPAAYKSNSIAPVMGPSRVPRRMLFFASKSRAIFKLPIARTHSTKPFIFRIDENQGGADRCPRTKLRGTGYEKVIKSSAVLQKELRV